MEDAGFARSGGADGVDGASGEDHMEETGARSASAPRAKDSKHRMNAGSIPCALCGQTFANLTGLKRHVRNKNLRQRGRAHAEATDADFEEVEASFRARARKRPPNRLFACQEGCGDFSTHKQYCKHLMHEHGQAYVHFARALGAVVLTLCAQDRVGGAFIRQRGGVQRVAAATRDGPL